MPQPIWQIPKDIVKAIEDADGIWEHDNWSPIMLTAMSDTELDGREIPIAWQIEFDPSDEEFESANETIEELGIEPDGYGWGDHIRKTINKSDPALAERLHLTDCETDNCVIWVETEDDCRKLIETTWRLIFTDP
jgi:hypothetical protein